jgi:HSP20 family protein
MMQNANRELAPRGKAAVRSTSQAPAPGRSGQEVGLSRPFARGPFSLMRRMSEEMDRVFEHFFGGSLPSEWNDWARPSGWWPAMEVLRTDGEVVIRADLPGVRTEDVMLEVDQNALVLQGERRQEHESHDGGVQRSERSYGSFYRAIPLPEGADVAQAKAEFRNGVLEIRVPAPQHSRRIPIATEAQG